MSSEIRNAGIFAAKLSFHYRDGLAIMLLFDLGEGEIRRMHFSTKSPSLGFELVSATLKTIGKSHWDNVAGSSCRIVTEGSRIIRIGNLLDDVWFDPQKIADNDKRLEPAIAKAEEVGNE